MELLNLLFSPSGIVVAGVVALVVGFMLMKKSEPAKWLKIAGGIFVVTGVLMLPSVGVVSSSWVEDLGASLSGSASALSIGDSSSGSEGGRGSSSESVPIDTLTATAYTKFNNDYSTVTASLDIYPKGVDPTNPNSNRLEVVHIASGSGSTSNGKVFTERPYRVILNGSTTYYAKDLGEIILLDMEHYNERTGKGTFEVGAVSTIGTLSDIINENSTDVNGQTGNWNNTSTVELLCANDTDFSTTGVNDNVTSGCNEQSFIYDISNGDGSYYLDLEIGCTGSNKECQDLALRFLFESGAEPEGNEYSSITAELRSGSDLGMPSELVDYFNDEIPVELGTVPSGTSSTYRFTFSASESNMDANDDFKIIVDDLGDYNGKDIASNSGASNVEIDMDHRA